MKGSDPLFQWRIHFWRFHAPRRGIASVENEQVPRKAAVIMKMIIILTMRLAGSQGFYGKSGRFVDQRKEEADKKSVEGCDLEKNRIRKDKEQ